MKSRQTPSHQSLVTLVTSLCFFLAFARLGHCANILIFHQIASYSHRLVTYPLAEALVAKGHEVTYITAHHPRGKMNPKIKEIIPVKFAKTLNDALDKNLDINLRVTKQLPRIAFGFYDLAVQSCEDLFSGPELQEYFANTTKVDLVLVDNYISECALGIAYKYGAKHIYFSTVVHVGNQFDVYGFPPESSSVPELEIDPPQIPMSFWQRVVNTLVSIHFRYEHYKYMSRLDAVIRTHLKDPDMPHIDDVGRNTSLVLYSGDVITDFPRSQPPLVVDISGMHCKNTTKPLPEEIDAFINDVSKGKTDGFIYISFGSFVVSSNMPEKFKKMFFDTMESFPQLKFLWKWNGDFPKNLPSNLYLSNWLPQADLLAHPKIRGFVTQAERPSTCESVCNAVPMIAIPISGDQDFNAKRMNTIGGNILLEIGRITQKELTNAIEVIAYNPRIRGRMNRFRKIIQDRPMPPLDTALWWIEYVLRHEDTLHLRSPGFNQHWFQRRLIDVWFFIFVSLWIGLKISRRIISYLIQVLIVFVKNSVRKFRFQRKQKVN